MFSIIYLHTFLSRMILIYQLLTASHDKYKRAEVQGEQFMKLSI